MRFLCGLPRLVQTGAKPEPVRSAIEPAADIVAVHAPDHDQRNVLGEDRLLRLAAEKWVPGRAWLQFEVEPDGDGAIIRQTAVFDPAGILGRLYWYAIAPIHGFVFRGMVRGIARAAVASRPATTPEEVPA